MQATIASAFLGWSYRVRLGCGPRLLILFTPEAPGNGIAEMKFSHLLIFYCGVCAAEEKEDKELSRDKKDVSAIKNLASSLAGNKFNNYPTDDYDWNRRYYPFNKFPSGGYHGSFGGSYVGTYERGIGGYVYDRPQQPGPWYKSTYPLADDTVVVYPVSGPYPSGPSSPGVIPTAVQPAYNVPPAISNSYLPVSAGPSFHTIPARPAVTTVNVGQSSPIPAPIPAPRPALSSVPTATGQYLPPATSGFGVSSTFVSQPNPVVSSRPFITSVVETQPFPAIGSDSVPVLPARPIVSTVTPTVSVHSVSPALSPTLPSYRPFPPAVSPHSNSIDTSSFGGYHYDKPDIPFF